MLNKEHIEGQLRTKWAAQTVVYKDVTESTNDDARVLAEQGAPHGTLVVADQQINGRGSRGRSWESPSGNNIAMSLIVRPKAPSERISMLTLIMGLSVAEGIEEAIIEFNDRPLKNGTDIDIFRQILSEISSFPQIKWPNDVVINGKKICGILTELHMNPDNTINNVVIGVGINVNMEDFPDSIKDIAGSILTETGKKLDRSSVVAHCMKCFEDNYEKYNKTFDLSLLKEQYERRLINKNSQVRILDPKGEYEAIARGITQDGALIVATKDGIENEINSGEVSVRGLYSYA